jgi:hypothetical protein
VKSVILFFLALISINSKAQIQHTIDEFSNESNYFTAFNVGNGTISKNINNSDFISGNSCLQINYSFNPSSTDFFSCFRNYSTATQDYSYQTNGFSIYSKNGNANTQLAIRLWEDINMNGIFDGEDEVYISSKVDLGNNSWTKHNFLINNFTKVTGNGNNTIDLNRIRGWDIAIYNTGGQSHSANLLIDLLQLNSNYTPPLSTNQKLTGSFIQLWNTSGCNCGNWNQTQWDNELQKMSDLCMNKLIIQYGVYNDFSWYTPSNLGFINYQSDALNKIFLAAEKVDINIQVGLYFDEEWNTANKSSSIEYDNLLIKHKAVIDEIWGLFGNSKSFGGWYIPQEINDLEWQGNTEQTLLFNWLKDVSDYAYSKSENKTIMIAPFNNLWQPADVIKNWYESLFSIAPNINSVFPQDGVGIGLKDINYHIPLYFDAINSACDNYNRTFGATIESFNQLTGWPIDNGSFSAESSSIQRLKKQLAEAATHTNDIIQFSWGYMQQDLTISSTNLFNEYSNYVNCLPTQINNTLNQEISFYPNPITDILNFNTQINIVEIYNTNGQLVLKSHNINSINLEDLTSGIYVMRINQKESKRLIIL